MNNFPNGKGTFQFGSEVSKTWKDVGVIPAKAPKQRAQAGIHRFSLDSEYFPAENSGMT